MPVVSCLFEGRRGTATGGAASYGRKVTMSDRIPACSGCYMLAPLALTVSTGECGLRRGDGGDDDRVWVGQKPWRRRGRGGHGTRSVATRARRGRRSPSPVSPSASPSPCPDPLATRRRRPAPRAATGSIRSSMRQPKMSSNAVRVRRLNRSGLSTTKSA